jgi:hypothetical protein
MESKEVEEERLEDGRNDVRLVCVRSHVGL